MLITTTLNTILILVWISILIGGTHVSVFSHFSASALGPVAPHFMDTAVTHFMDTVGKIYLLLIVHMKIKHTQ
jgi:hypothetical protein